MRFFVAFVISLFIYMVFIWLFMTQFTKVQIPEKTMNERIVKIDIINMPLPKKVEPAIAKTAPKPIVKKIIKKKVVKKKVTKKKIVKKKSIKKKVVKKKIVKKKIVKKKIVKKKISKKPKPKVVEEMVYIEEPFITEPKEVKNSDDLASFLGTQAPSPSPVVKSYPNNKIKKLYGSAFHSFTPTQKEFIENNLNEIQRITQNLLNQRGYPEGAGRNGQEGTNVVSFNLHPNGDISGLRLKKRIGSRPLDDNTLSLIRSAYKDYPYPSTTTRIVFYVSYSIYGY
jgi:TonB family protein